jgi:hypothetical protein
VTADVARQGFNNGCLLEQDQPSKTTISGQISKITNYQPNMPLDNNNKGGTECPAKAPLTCPRPRTHLSLMEATLADLVVLDL